MKVIENWNEIKEKGSNKMLEIGGYVCKIKSVKNNEEKKYLEIEYDIAGGENKDFFENIFTQYGFWSGKCYVSYNDKMLGNFKHFVSCIEKSNQGFTWNWDETTLVNKLIGFTITQEEYRNKNGEIKFRYKVKNFYTSEDIMNNKFKMPEKIYLIEDDSAIAEDDSDESLPF